MNNTLDHLHDWVGKTETRVADRKWSGDAVRIERYRAAGEDQEDEAIAVEWGAISAKTVEEAKDRALAQLGCDEPDSEFAVREEPHAGVLGRAMGAGRHAGGGGVFRGGARRRRGSGREAPS